MVIGTVSKKKSMGPEETTRKLYDSWTSGVPETRKEKERTLREDGPYIY